jgi:hypothetical protein
MQEQGVLPISNGDFSACSIEELNLGISGKRQRKHAKAYQERCAAAIPI